MKTPTSSLCILLLLSVVSRGGFSQEEVSDPVAFARFIGEEHKANKARLAHGKVRANLRQRLYGQDGKTVTQDISTSATMVFAGGNVWCEMGNAQERRTILRTEELFCLHNLNDPNAYVEDPETGGILEPFEVNIRPTRNFSFGDPIFAHPEDALSMRAWKEPALGKEVYRFEIVVKAYPAAVLKNYVDLEKGCMVLRHEIHHNFGEGKGYVLLRSREADVQSTPNGGWYLKHFVERAYRPDSTLSCQLETRIVDFDFVSQIPEDTFTLEGMGLELGTIIVDRRMGDIHYSYGSPPADQNAIKSIVDHPLVKRAASKPVSAPPPTVEPETSSQAWNRGPGGPNEAMGGQTVSSRRKVLVTCGVGVLAAALLAAATWRAFKRRPGR